MTGAFTVTIPLVVLFLARALDGITGGNLSVANAYLADITAESDRSANFGKMAVSGNLGFVLGPAIAGALGATALGEVPPVVAALLISVVASLIIGFKLPESTPLLDQIDRMVEVAGIDHVGLGSDLDVPHLSTPEGIDDVTDFPRITQGLLERAHAVDDVEKILGSNFLRVLDEVAEG